MECPHCGLINPEAAQRCDCGYDFETKTVKTVKCPRCGLINPEAAQRCDCGYDFETKTLKTSYFSETLGGTSRLGLPYSLYLYALAMLFWFRVVAFLAAGLAGGFRQVGTAPYRSIAFIAWALVALPLLFQVSRKKRWAATVLAVITMPWGVWLLTSRRLRVFLLQQGDKNIGRP